MRVLVAPQEFKGSLTATEAAEAMAAGVREALPDATVVQVPMSDGGAGLVDALLAARGGQRIASAVHDPLMRPIEAEWARLADGSAAIEMAAASGLVLLDEAERDPLVATTYGTGELIAAAVSAGCREVIVGVGGSATVDGGAGALQALAERLLDATGRDLPPGGAALARLAHIDLAAAERRLAGVRLRVACDVTNVLCGPKGAAGVYGPQKGATPAAVRRLDAALRRWANVVRDDRGLDLLSLAGGGAAGGLAAGLHVLGGRIEPGFALVAGVAELEAKVAAADLVVTGEGHLDAQSSYGKTTAGVARLARRHGKPVAAVAGGIDGEAGGSFDVAVAVAPPGTPAEEAMRDAAALLRRATAEAVRRLAGSSR